MKLTPSLLALCAMLALPLGAAADPPPQRLSIAFHGDGARATQLPQYDPSEPIAIEVNESSGQPIDGVTVDAAGPDGEMVRAPLARGAGGSFAGTLSLAESGTWRVRLTSRSGKASVETSPVMLDLAAPPPSDAWQIGLAVGVAIFLVIGGSGFWILRRVLAPTSGPGRAAAA